VELRKVGIQALTSLVLGLPSHVSADLLEEFSRNRAFAYETSTILKKKQRTPRRPEGRTSQRPIS